MSWKLDLGASVVPGKGVSFKVWAPAVRSLTVILITKGRPQEVPLARDSEGFFCGFSEKARQGDKYLCLLDGSRERSDPASRFQPKGVHGPSQIVSSSHFRWSDKKWKGLSPEELIFYEIHIGAFTRGGTFESAARMIPYLKSLGITCVEIMPVGEFPGKRNWGYDGVGLYAVQNSYGGPEGLKTFVDACHRAGIAVALDVVYNHFGPEGNYLRDFGPYFTKKYKTPWGEAVNFDDKDSRHVRSFIIQNALYWVSEFHVDVLRLDAIHAIFDSSSPHILEEIKAKTSSLAKELGRKVQVIAESDLNNSRIIREKKAGGFALDAQWSDDFHHAVHAALTGERNGYYQDFGGISDIAKAYAESFVFSGGYSAYRKKCHGNSAHGIPGRKFVVAIQNHDQTGNRALGDRLSTLVGFEQQKLAAVLLLLSPYLPLIFMGEEYGENAPFQYFVDHSDPKLIEAVRRGRKRDFASFKWKGVVPDPQDIETFKRSCLSWTSLARKRHRFLLRLHQDLIAFRKSETFAGIPRQLTRKVRFDEKGKWLSVEYTRPSKPDLGILFSFAPEGRRLKWPFSKKRGGKIILHTSNSKYGGPSKTLKRSDESGVWLEPYCAVVITGRCPPGRG